MASKELKNLPRLESIIICKRKKGLVSSEGSESPQVLSSTFSSSSTRDSESSHNVIVVVP